MARACSDITFGASAGCPHPQDGTEGALTAPELVTRAAPTLPLDERELARRVRGGDEAAFESIFRAHHAALWRFAFGLVHSRDVAEELVQEVFLAVWRERRDWEPTGAVRGWLFAAVRNHALNHLRHERVVSRLEERLAAQDGTSGAAAVRTGGEVPVAMSAPAPDAQSAVEARELDEAVDRAIAALPERRRMAMALRWKHGLTAAEIAVVLKTTPASVRVLLTRARHELSALLDLAD